MRVRCQSCGTSLEAEARFCGLCGAPITDPNVGRVIAGRYLLQEKIGAGSLGLVYIFGDRAARGTVRRDVPAREREAEPELRIRVAR